MGEPLAAVLLLSGPRGHPDLAAEPRAGGGRIAGTKLPSSTCPLPQGSSGGTHAPSTFPQQRSLLPKALISQDRDIFDAPQSTKICVRSKANGKMHPLLWNLKAFPFLLSHNELIAYKVACRGRELPPPVTGSSKNQSQAH